MSDLFSNTRPKVEEIYPDCFVLANFVKTSPLFDEVQHVSQHSPFRKMMTPNGHSTGISLTNCGRWGWVSDANAYRYSQIDPLSNKPWQAIPNILMKIAKKAALTVGFEQFEPDACLINRYYIGNKLGSHQDKNEQDYNQPIVSISMGLPATFQIFGENRSGIVRNYRLTNGDVMVWGRSARLAYHGVRAIAADKLQPHLKQRINITLRKAR